VSDAAHHCVQLRIDLLFTMSDNLHRAIDEINAIQISNAWTSIRKRRSANRSTAAPLKRLGGARRDRTDDLLLAKQALSQLSYGPGWNASRSKEWWAWEDSNFRPHAYQARALTN
jgi:hypothetical protein